MTKNLALPLTEAQRQEFVEMAGRIVPDNMRGKRGTVIMAFVKMILSRSPDVLRAVGNAFLKYAEELENGNNLHV